MSTTECGIYWEIPQKTARTRIGAGYQVGRPIVEAPTEVRKSSCTAWSCRCNCESEIRLDARCLQRGTVTNCGCLQSETYRDNLKLVNGTSIIILEAGKHKLLSSNVSGHTGMYRKRKSGKWAAQITFKEKTYCLGFYTNRQDAVRARQGSQEMHNDFLAWHHADFSLEPEVLGG